MTNDQNATQAVLGQKYAFATASLVLGIASFITLLGLEKGILAIVFGLMALRSSPPPRLEERRVWSKLGVGLGIAQIALAVTLLVFHFDRVVAFMDIIQRVGH